MSRICQLTGIKLQFGHNVSHSERKTNRRFNPNLQNARITSQALKTEIRLKVTAKALRSIDAAGGFDNYILKASDLKLSKKLQKIKQRILNEKGDSSKI